MRWKPAQLVLAGILAGCSQKAAVSSPQATVSNDRPDSALADGRVLYVDEPFRICGFRLPVGSKVYEAEISPCDRDFVAILGQEWPVGERSWPAGTEIAFSACEPPELRVAGFPASEYWETWVRWIHLHEPVQIGEQELPAEHRILFYPEPGGAYLKVGFRDDPWDRCESSTW